MNFQTMSKQRKFLMIAAVAGLISVFLPWMSASAGALGYSVSRSINGFRDLGILYTLLMGGIIAITGFMGDQTQLLDKNMRLAVMAAGIISLISLLFFIKNSSDSIGGGFGVVDVSPSIGLLLAAAVAIAVIIIPLVIKKAGESFQSDIAHLKGTIQTAAKGREHGAITVSGGSQMNELEKLIQWKAEGKISEEEYQMLKSKIMP